MKSCPFCDSPDYYVHIRVSGTITENHRFDGGEADNTDMWDSARLHQRPTAYCRGCGKRIGRAGHDGILVGQIAPAPSKEPTNVR